MAGSPLSRTMTASAGATWITPGWRTDEDGRNSRGARAARSRSVSVPVSLVGIRGRGDPGLAQQALRGPPDRWPPAERADVR